MPRVVGSVTMPRLARMVRTTPTMLMMSLWATGGTNPKMPATW